MAGQLDVSHNIQPFADGMAEAPGIIREEFLRTTDRITLQGEAFAKQLTPVRTGHLRRSITHTPAVWAGGARGEYGTATTYAKYVEYGRGPIVARGKALRFTVGGKVVYAKRVRAAKPRPFMRPSVHRLRPIAVREYQAATKRVIARVTGGG